jgi:hypothetical protein
VSAALAGPLVDRSPSAAEAAARVGDAEYARLLLVPRARLAAGLLRERAVAARAWYAAHGSPWLVARRVEVARLDADGAALEGGAWLPGAAFAGRLVAAEGRGLWVVLATAGPEVDDASAAAWAEGRPDDGFFLERFGVAVTEDLLRGAAVALCREAEAAGETLLPPLSPGCGDWELEAQAPLWSLLAGDAAALGPVALLESGQLRPKASVLAALGIVTRATKAAVSSPRDACRACDLHPCAFRRAAYRGEG